MNSPKSTEIELPTWVCKGSEIKDKEDSDNIKIISSVKIINGGESFIIIMDMKSRKTERISIDELLTFWDPTGKTVDVKRY
jgi:hypothetical protein